MESGDFGSREGFDKSANHRGLSRSRGLPLMRILFLVTLLPEFDPAFHICLILVFSHSIGPGDTDLEMQDHRTFIQPRGNIPEKYGKLKDQNVKEIISCVINRLKLLSNRGKFVCRIGVLVLLISL